MGKRFRIRTISGATACGFVGGEVTSFQIENTATGGRQEYTFVGVGTCLPPGASASGPGSWTDFECSNSDLSEQSFEGAAVITSGGSSVGVGGGFTNIDWLSGPAKGENARGLGVGTGLGIGAQGNWGYMNKR